MARALNLGVLRALLSSSEVAATGPTDALLLVVTLALLAKILERV